MSEKQIEDSIIISGNLVSESRIAWLVDCEGDREWFLKSQCNYDAEKKELEAPKWLLKKKFPDENF